jgi:carboxymethylenebutenolidase
VEDNEKPTFVRAAGGVSSNVIKTSSAGLSTSFIKLPCGETAFIARPEKQGIFPVILLAHEIFGLHEHILDLARRLALDGYLVIAPDYLSRYGDIATASSIDALRLIVAQASDATTLATFDEAFEVAVNYNGDLQRVAMTGFCWGGRIVWLYSAHNSKIRACVPWYGRLDGERTSQQEYWPIDLAGQLKAPTLGLYSGADPTIPRELINKFQKQLLKHNAPAEIKIYNDAPHGFCADYRETYRPDAAKLAWREMCAFFKRHHV